MRKEIDTFLSEKTLNKLSDKQKKEMQAAINNNHAIFFTGEGAVGKTYLARLFQENGLDAFAPEMVCIVNLKTGEVKYDR